MRGTDDGEDAPYQPQTPRERELAARRRLAAADLAAGWFCGPWLDDCVWPACDCYPKPAPVDPTAITPPGARS